MSIVRQLIQICMVEAIRGRTLAGDAVLDSNIAAIGKLDFKDEQHVVACSVEESDQNEKYGRGFFGRPADLKLYVQIAVAVKAKYTIVTGEGEEQVEEVKEIGATDAAREATLNILDRQWKQALIDPANPWGDRFRQLVPTIGRVMDTRITDPEGGRKYAARVYEISATAIAEPEFGVGMPTDIDAILRAAGALDQGYARLEAIWRDVFTKSASGDETALLQASAALSATAFGALGLNVIEPDGGNFSGAVIAVDDLDPVVTPGDADDQPEALTMEDMGDLLAKIVADAIQPILRDVHMLKSAFSRMVKEGAVEEIDAEKGYRIKLGEGTDGQPYLSGWVPHPETGKTSVPLKKGQRVALLSPGGDIRQALLLRSGYSDEHASPNSNMEANVFEDAGVRAEVADGKLTVTIGGATFEFSGSGLTMNVGGASFVFSGSGFTQTGGMQMHDDKDVGATHTNLGLRSIRKEEMSGIDRHTGKVIDNLQSALQGVEVVFITRLGERVMRREFGAGLIELIGRLVSLHLLMAFQQLIVTAIDLWEPRFKVRRILFEGSAEQIRLGTAKFGIEADYRPRGHLGDFAVERLINFSLTFDGRGVRAA